MIAESTMSDPAGVLDVLLGPGDLYFGDRHTRIRTLLGSCVAITLWHPVALIGGMCHYMMPTRHGRHVQPGPSTRHVPPIQPVSSIQPGRVKYGPEHHGLTGPGPHHGLTGHDLHHDPHPDPHHDPHHDLYHDLSGRYADEALQILLHEIQAAGTSPHDYQVKMFGGGNQVPGQLAIAVDVAARNIDAGLHLLADIGLEVTSMHLGGTGHREVVLDVWSGDVWVRHHERTEEMAAR